ncbi:uncharacterized protein LOC121370314 isoform X2 [Gigantopelta aegis]|uniref:uncharacterized protein LOC121370314 isoform X2 n=1 Tax=Gigantopelta aegis TaxID=1735272 RepID=UPI001B88CA20|nr:uncharacterized protein LOC121370314 isoform X2 [Gigantopelta aegis]
MRYAYLLVLLVTFAVLHESDAWFLSRRSWRRLKRWSGRALLGWAAKKAVFMILAGKRDVSEYDTNKDGVLDVDELEKVMSTRDAENLFEISDHDATKKTDIDLADQLST